MLQAKHPSWPLGCGVDTEKAFLTEGRVGALGSRPGAPLFSTVSHLLPKSLIPCFLCSCNSLSLSSVSGGVSAPRGH